MTTDDKKVIYSMMRVGKVVPPNKQILRDISLSYFYGAKIGVLGLNGAGKSTLLKIMAGVDQDFLGETAVAPGYSIGYLEQEPQLDDSKTVRDIVEEGAQETVDALREFDEINMKFAEPMTRLMPGFIIKLISRTSFVARAMVSPTGCKLWKVILLPNKLT